MTAKESLERPTHRNSWMLLASLIVLASLDQQASARIGDTPEQCEARYGKPVCEEAVNANNIIVYYMMAGSDFRIAINFYEGKADCISFRRMHTAGTKAENISKSQIEIFLQLNGGDIKWKQVGEDIHSWVTEDGELLSDYDRDNSYDLPELVIKTKAYVARKKVE